MSLGGALCEGDGVVVTSGEDAGVPRPPLKVKGKRFHGACQMMQLSLDGRRIYVTGSLLSVWDKQFYPKMAE